jgi:DNA-binding LacI/PurR family transcriptional regulator
MSLPTQADVAKEAGVSTSTVSLFLNKKPGVSKEAQESIAAAMKKLGYSPRQLKKKKGSNLIGIMIENLAFSAFSDVLYLQVLQGFEKEARSFGFHTVITTIDTQRQLEIPKAIEDGEFAGVVALGGGDMTDEFLFLISTTGVPMVMIDNYLMGGDIDAILADNEIGAYFATRHLIEKGYQRIAVITGPKKYKPLTDRLQGFLRAMVETGKPLQPWQIQPTLSKGIPNKGYLEMKSLLSLPEPPDAVFCVSDRTAFGALGAINEAGLCVPKDIALVGFDDIPECQRSTPPLTTVHMQKWEMGIEAAQRLAKVINQPNQEKNITVKITLPTYLVPRASS